MALNVRGSYWRPLLNLRTIHQDARDGLSYADSVYADLASLLGVVNNASSGRLIAA